ncbi:hypothetical protein P153DRAFT_377670 [Dothidotthia symphoricarpi CBS 119687]|uniref:Zn(2)-C6 fungal-type domain-containing protein n=1 Tax=Dothidotthia symphoricarpi CBS 119687 TaxID=1392245 RepID=A0A6A6A794_9PLEO|nr:uncharacterized protein P153DRAFT_377670 [Dothidotthia symphoricarpi CBS 119687]KAF2127446.1 hypothetical protein P153DRAFT_377670 [Dothidotthia symphoricarpi CBS 119687]
MQYQKEGRSTMSCTECQRRKQKCSREWPCNHCQARKVAHLCQFGVKKAQEESPTESIRETPSEVRGQKRSFQSQESFESSGASSGQSEEPEDGLKVWGYMPGHIHYKIGTVEDGSRRQSASSDAANSYEVDKVMYAIPPRSITDGFIKYFLRVVNYRYSAIYGPTFTDNYVQWWTDRTNGKRLPPEFTCLLLRICAYTVQYLPSSLRNMAEFELACDSQGLIDRFASAAEQLSQSFEASNTCIERVQEQFLKGAWLKSESKIVESWHTLSSTIRAAQELGIDRDANVEDLSEFDIEIRRRIWTLLYIWDWQMSSWLGRPNLIDQKNLTFIFPTLRLDQSATEPNLLSPFAHMALQAHLGRRVATAIGDAESGNELSAEQVLAVEAECERFIEELPPIFKVKDPDTSLDAQHSYFIFQRSQLHCVIYVTMLHFLKPYLTRTRDETTTDQDDEFRRMGVNIALLALGVAQELFNYEFPINAKFHMVVFSIFDTATILCSAIIHDRGCVLPRRDDIMNIIESSLDMLYQLSLTTKLGAASYNFLYKLVQATPELRSLPCCKRRKRSSPSMLQSSPPICTPPVALPAAPTETTAIPATINKSSLSSGTHPQIGERDPLPSMTTTDDLCFDLDQFLAQNPFGAFGNQSALDMGGMEQIWDWENLNLDGQVEQGISQ